MVIQEVSTGSIIEATITTFKEDKSRTGETTTISMDTTSTMKDMETHSTDEYDHLNISSIIIIFF